MPEKPIEEFTFAVITKIPEWKKDAGNQCDEIIEPWQWRRDLTSEDSFRFPQRSCVVRLPAFVLGEILILNEHEREVDGHMRKPSKWTVEYECFDTLRKAVACTRKVLKE